LRSRSQKQTTKPPKQMARTAAATHIDHVMGDRHPQFRVMG
jgi:hypothetical protein